MSDNWDDTGTNQSELIGEELFCSFSHWLLFADMTGFLCVGSSSRDIMQEEGKRWLTT